MATIVTVDRLPALLAAVQGLTGNHVLVGIPGDVPLRKPLPGATRPSMPNATIGYIQEFGSPAANIPPRPFLRPGVQSALPAVITRLRLGAAKALILGADHTVAMKTLMAVGLIAQNAVRFYINRGVPPALKPSTLAARRNRKVAPRTGTKPLIDTGQLRNSVQYVIRAKGSLKSLVRSGPVRGNPGPAIIVNSLGLVPVPPP